MNTNAKLKDFVSIRSGMVVSKTANNDEALLTDAFVRMIVTSDYDEDGNLRNDLEANVLMKPSIEKNFLKNGEILFNAKGRRFFAALFQEEYQHAIASSSFLVITVKSYQLEPEFLVWFLGHPETLKIFDSKMSTQVMPTITKQELAELEIILPSKEVQHRIVKIDQLKKKQVKIQKELIELKENYINAITYKRLKNEQ